MLPEEDEIKIVDFELEDEVEVVEAPKPSNVKKGMIIGGALIAALILINILNYALASEQSGFFVSITAEQEVSAEEAVSDPTDEEEADEEEADEEEGS